MSNFIYLYGPTGSGKTRLLERYYNCILRQGINGRRASVEQLLSDLHAAIGSGTVTTGFTRECLSLDVLLVDNAWLLQKQPHAKKLLFSLFFEMVKCGKVVVMSGDIATEEFLNNGALEQLSPVLALASDLIGNRDTGDKGDEAGSTPAEGASSRFIPFIPFIPVKHRTLNLER